MKKIFSLVIFCIGSMSLVAQEPADALRYSWTQSSGTARQMAIGGAMTSLGGDISAVFVNPAGLGFFKTGDFVITPGFQLDNTNATYYGRKESAKKNSFSFGTSGIVMGTENDNRRRNKSGVAIGFAINKMANFNRNILYRGENMVNSYSQKFLDEINNNNDHDANSVANNYPFGTSLAFNTYWIDTVDGGSAGNFQFQTRAPIGNLLQENEINTTGGITELALGFAMNKNDKFYFGGSIGIPFLNYKRESSFTEADATTNPNNNFDYANITESLKTTGAGINLKLGIIYKPQEHVRLGLAFHSPTLFTLTDAYNANVTTNTENYHGQLTQSSLDFTGGQNAEFKYWLISPYRIMASASYVLREIEDVRKQKGFITADLEYVNYKASSFTTDPNGDQSVSTKTYLKSLNTAIDNAYKGTFNFKAGGELKFTTLMARLGFAFFGNPYQNLSHGEKGSRFQLSGGLGYRNKGMFIDLTYVHTMGKDVHFAYRLQNTPYSGAALKQTAGTILATIGFKI
ncbi:MAG: outer membrane protein transport protein [Chitinophagaceae bacterium]|nr:outer membrane protein transport protein [Chitinophagaceae bacterium]